MRTWMLVLLATVSTPAFAGSDAFAVKTMREPLSTREVERSLILPKGWLQLELAWDRHVGVGVWSPEGEKDLFETTTWTYDEQRARVSYGLSPQWELWWEVPFRQGRLVNPALGTTLSDGGLNDPRLGAKFELLQRDPPAPIGVEEPPEPRKTSIVLLAEYKGPAGKESPGTYIGGPLNQTGLIFTTGTPDLQVGIAAKHQLGPIGLTGRFDYVRRFAGVVQYLVELEQLQFLGRLKPGDQLRLEAKVELQAGPIVPYGAAKVVRRDLTRIGTTSKTPTPNKTLDDVAESDGIALDLDAGLLVSVSRGVDVRAHVVLPLVGEDLQFFPIEDLQPTYGPTFGGSLQVRY